MINEDAFAYPERSETIRTALERTMDGLADGHVTLRELLHNIGDHGPLILCAVLTLPFLLPVSIPGVSTAFGLAIIFLAVGIVANRKPWLPDRIMDRPLSADKLKGVLTRSLSIVDRVENVVRERAVAITGSSFANRVNGLAILACGILLMFPLGLVPFSNTLPAFAILFLSVGMAQRDGVVVLAGYGMLVATIIYFSILAYGAFAAGRGLSGFFSG
ncbi:exopolysaccharide biosynthesis protein [Aliihoeflea sp. 40Bstr573]|uniref:exopolysaccharide biosynthesis protein n=1 Tax=Aliihoeflea sp. 40Bstr573 TaxID=2696467 RepID=UPI0020962371|nr:exopolysaccharide biosynthesis protein [Aliihoeflea sp. 40Bstr573]MCO6386449.1 exopolysaccharide biosynthesis protein [Aliihoeflea sp. 40Bstr573]